MVSTSRPEFGSPAASLANGFEDVPLTRPSVPDAKALAEEIVDVLESGTLTNGPRVKEFEARVAEYIGVKHCIAVASCTSGLMLVLRAADIRGDVVVPSFTFAATAHAVAWNGLTPLFADVDPRTLTLSPDAVRRALGVRTSAILATHTFGTPCDVEALDELARRHGLRLFFDAAHALGSHRNGVPVGGFGDAEVFSLSPTKVVIAGEGGIIATNDDVLADRCRIGRDYGNPGDYNCQFVGLNGRMSEIHAAVAIASFRDVDEHVERRNELARRYREELSGVSGIDFPQVSDADRSTYKDFTILVDPDLFGVDADVLGRALAAVGIETRRYYSPPVHAMQAYRSIGGMNGHLPVTELVASRVLTLPMWSEMRPDQVTHVVDAMLRIRRYSKHSD